MTSRLIAFGLIELVAWTVASSQRCHRQTETKAVCSASFRGWYQFLRSLLVHGITKVHTFTYGLRELGKRWH